MIKIKIESCKGDGVIYSLREWCDYFFFSKFKLTQIYINISNRSLLIELDHYGSFPARQIGINIIIFLFDVQSKK